MPNSSLGDLTFSGDLFKNVKGLSGKLNSAIGLYMNYQTPKVQDYMRHNAPWTDRTGNARNGLFAKYVNVDSDKFTIVVYHTLPYGIWLEVRNSGQYAVISPTVTNEGRRIMDGLRGLLGKMVGGPL